MSIRISKDIGYYIPKKNFSKIFVRNFIEIIDDWEYAKEQEFFNKLIDKIRTDENTLTMLGDYRAKQYEEYYKEGKKFVFSSLISKVYFFDTFKGVLFKTIDLDKNSRHDDTMDYYETDSKMKCSIKSLYRPIYPVSGYNYNGDIIDLNVSTKEKIEEIQKKLKRKFFNTSEAMAIYRIVSNGVKKEFAALKEMNKSKMFTPCIDEEIYLMAKILGVLKEGITQKEFEMYCEPSIVTTWS